MKEIDVFSAIAGIELYLSRFIEVRSVDLSFKHGDFYDRWIDLTVFYMEDGKKRNQSVHLKEGETSIDLLLKKFLAELGIDPEKYRTISFTIKSDYGLETGK